MKVVLIDTDNKHVDILDHDASEFQTFDDNFCKEYNYKLMVINDMRFLVGSEDIYIIVEE